MSDYDRKLQDIVQFEKHYQYNGQFMREMLLQSRQAESFAAPGRGCKILNLALHNQQLSHCVIFTIATRLAHGR